MQINYKSAAGTLAGAALIAILAACGGGGSGGDATSTGTGSGTSGASSASATSFVASVSTGAITAFGSVFINGHEFNTNSASVVDDDTGTRTPGTRDLDVGMVVSVTPTSGSTPSALVASEIHVDPLAKGFVDVNTASTGTLAVMGQAVQITSSTGYVDQRACVVATSSPCSAITSQSGLNATSGSTPGSYVTVHGYLFSTGTAAQIVGTLISVQDYVAPTATTKGSPFKLEGKIISVSGNSAVIGGETVNLGTASCSGIAAGSGCNSILTVGNTIAALGFTAPTGSTFTAATGRLIRLLPQAAGAQVEIEGKVSSVTGTSVVVQGITIDGSALSAGQIPAIGDEVQLLGTMAANGQSVKATSILQDKPAAPARYALAGPLASVSAGATANTYVVAVLGLTATVNASTMIVDQTVRPRPTFNISNFQTYLQGLSALPYVILQAQTTSSGGLQAIGFQVVKAPSNKYVSITGPADGGITVGNPGSVKVRGISVLFNAGAVRGAVSIAKGTNILVVGSLSSAGAIDTTAAGGMFSTRGSTEQEDFGF